MSTIVIPIQGFLPELLDAPREETAWVITITLLVSAVCVPIAGKLGDMYGRRRLALIVLGILIVGATISALSTSVAMLIFGRGLQGAGNGVIALGMAILRDELPNQRLGSAIALLSGTVGVGAALGLPLGALIAEQFEWRMLFWMATAIGILSFILVAAAVPPSQIRTGGRVDVLGTVGLTVGLVAILLAISWGNEWGWLSPPTPFLIVGGVVVLLAWGWFELRVHDPLVDLRVSARGPVLITNLAGITMGFSLFGTSIVFPQFLALPVVDGGAGLTLLQAGFVMMPAGVAMLAMAPIAGRIQLDAGPKPLLIMGAVTIALAYGLGVLLELQLWSVLLINLVIGMGIGLGFAAMPALIMQSVPATETGAANGLNSLTRSLGSSTAAAVLAAVLAASATQIGGSPIPSTDGFRVALLIGLLAAIATTVFASTIPRPKENWNGPTQL